MIEFDIKGSREIEDLFLRLASNYKKPRQALKHLKKPVRNALKIAQKKLKARVGTRSASGKTTGGGHEITGALRKSIKITVRSANRKYRRRHPNAVIMAQVGYIWKRSQVPDDFYKRVLALEYGTRYQTPRRYVQRTLITEGRKVTRKAITDIKQDILQFIKQKSQINKAKNK